MNNLINEFDQEKKRLIAAQGADARIKDLANKFIVDTAKYKYSYLFSWLGRPIIQFPQDMLAIHEIIWRVQPDLVIETGIAHGGSLIFSASMLELNAICGGPANAMVLGIDIEIRSHNRSAIEAHPLSRRIEMVEGSSISSDIIKSIHRKAQGNKQILIMLDSNHTHAHVLAELEAYAPLVSLGSYCVVFDTVIEDMPDGSFINRPWGVSNNPKTAVWEYLKNHPEFAVDKDIENKLMITVAPDGYLKRIC